MTPRELQVIELVAAGLDHRTIGQRLGISEKTARNRVSAISGKNRRQPPQAIAWARGAGFGHKRSPDRS
jgi:DNA-binding NarL/FixJ family response regulator